MKETVIYNAQVVTPTAVLPQAAVLIRGASIAEVAQEADPGKRWPDAERIDAEGAYLMPGFIDVHSDNIENLIQPRATSIMDFELAMREQEKQLANEGITTMYHSLSLMVPVSGVTKELRQKDNMLRLVDLIQNFHEGEHLIRHRFHCRYEITNLDVYPMLEDLIRQGKIQLLSFMDHTPGQGQYRDLVAYKKLMARESSDREKDEMIQKRMRREKLTEQQICRAAQIAHEMGIAVASHDDDSVEKIDFVSRQLGADISEFPVELEVAREAKKRGMKVVVGAPNVLMGYSHSGNLSALEAIQNDCADILCSDYYPPAILHAVFRLAERCALPLWKAVNMATYHPACALGISSEYGSIEPGKYADLILVSKKGTVPVILGVFINGVCVSKLQYRRDTAAVSGDFYD